MGSAEGDCHTLTRVAPLGERNKDGLSSRSGAKAVVKGSSATGDLAARATTTRTVAEADVGRSRQAICARGIDTCAATVVNGAMPSANVVLPRVAVDNPGGTAGDGVTSVFSATPDEGELGIGGGDPVVELLVSDESLLQASL